MTHRTCFTILISLAGLLALMALLGLVARLVAGTPDPAWIGVTALLVVATILAALYAGPSDPDTPDVPGQRVFLYLLLSVAAGFLWWALGRGIPALTPFDLSPLLVGLIAYFLLIGSERRRGPQALAPDRSTAVTAPAAKPKRRTSRSTEKRKTAPKRRTAKRKIAKRRSKARR